MKIRVAAGYLGVTNINRRIILFVFAFLFFSPSVYKEVWGDESDDIKKQMQELRQQMESMQKKLQELEERNKKLEEEAKKQKEEREIEETIGEDVSPPPKPGYLQRFVQSLNPDISIIGIFAGAYFSTDDPIVHAEADPENTGINLQEVEVGFQGVVDPYVRFGFVNTNNNSFVPPQEKMGFSPQERNSIMPPCLHSIRPSFQG